MRHYRSVDDADRWMRTAVKEDMIVEALATAVVGEIQAQAHHISTLDIEISRLNVVIRGLEKEIEVLNEENATKSGTIDRMKQIVKELGIKAKVMRMLKEEF